MKRKIVVGLGEVLWDVYEDRALFGGAPANFACHAASLGAEARIASAVGTDRLGTEALLWMQAHELSCHWVSVDPEHPTGSVLVVLDAHGSPQYRFASDVAWDFLNLQAHWIELAGQCDAVCYGTLALRSEISARAILGFLEHTQRDAIRVFDVNLRQDFYSAEVLSACIERANIVKLNHEELPIVARLLGLASDCHRSMCEALVEQHSLRGIALTRGSEGSAVFLDGQWDEQPALKVTAIDTVGAGDSFTAALTMGILDQRSLPQIHSQAARIAAYVCTQRGAVVPLPASLTSP
jgi:fructokinase